MSRIEVSKEKLEKLLEIVGNCDDCPLTGGKCEEMPGKTCYETLMLWVQNDIKKYRIGTHVEDYVEYEVEAPSLEEAIAQLQADLDEQYCGPSASYEITYFEED